LGYCQEFAYQYPGPSAKCRRRNAISWLVSTFLSGLELIAVLRDAGVFGVYGESLPPSGVGILGSVEGDIEFGGFSRKLILLLEEVIEADGEAGGGIVLRDLVGEGIV
jgi:hypothetical protein